MQTKWLLALSGLLLCVARVPASADPGAAAMLMSLAPAVASDESWASEPIFDEGAWTMQAYVSGTFGDEDHGNLYTAHTGFGYFLKDDFSINVDFLAGIVNTGPVSGDDDGIVGGFDLLFRWHFLQRDKWSLYVDGGCGVQVADTDFPSDSHFNFRPQLGVGLTYQLTQRLHLLAGIRYLHISNAHTTSGNDGLDGAMVYGGAMWGF